MSCKVLQHLLSSGEYDELEDVVIAEGEFIETDDSHNPSRQVILGMTPFNLIIAERYITNYKDHPEVYFLTDVDPYTNELEVSSVWSICLIRMEYSVTRYELTIRLYDKIRFYELTNTRLNGDLEDTWARWIERVVYLKEDPYGYIRAQFDEFHIPCPEYYVNRSSRDQKTDESSSWKCLELDDIDFLETYIEKYEQDEKNSKKKKKESELDKKRRKKSKKKKWLKKDKK